VGLVAMLLNSAEKLPLICIIEANEAGFSRSGEPSRIAGAGPRSRDNNPRTPTHPLIPFASLGIWISLDSLCLQPLGSRQLLIADLGNR
jgi:hypothetical protein